MNLNFGNIHFKWFLFDHVSLILKFVYVIFHIKVKQIALILNYIPTSFFKYQYIDSTHIHYTHM